MKTRCMKRLFTVMIVLAMTMGSTMTAFAEDGDVFCSCGNCVGGNGGCTCETDTSKAEACVEGDCSCTPASKNGCKDPQLNPTKIEVEGVPCYCGQCSGVSCSCGEECMSGYCLCSWSDGGCRDMSTVSSRVLEIISNETNSEPEPAPTYEEQHSQTANASISVAGTNVQTSVAGVYATNEVQGCAVTTSADDVKTALNLEDGQKASIIIYDTDEEKSYMAMASVNSAIESIGGGDMVASIYVDLSAKQDGKKIELSDGSVGMQVGLPKDADTTKTYAIICVQPGGATTILEDQDTNPKTVTFEVQVGVGTYAFVAQ